MDREGTDLSEPKIFGISQPVYSKGYEKAPCILFVNHLQTEQPLGVEERAINEYVAQQEHSEPYRSEKLADNPQAA
jgi:hypothetical protein